MSTYVVWVFFAVLQMEGNGPDIPFMIAADSAKECRTLHRAATDGMVRPVSKCEEMKLQTEKK